ncbi:MAG: hypothetical protein GY801_22300, partial [bacterium]|nr:hypothetical protein [bacterium]
IPVPPHTLGASIPETVSNIVLKLMAKNAEDRYQSSSGIGRDLKDCLPKAQARINPYRDEMYTESLESISTRLAELPSEIVKVTPELNPSPVQ